MKNWEQILVESGTTVRDALIRINQAGTQKIGRAHV